MSRLLQLPTIDAEVAGARSSQALLVGLLNAGAQQMLSNLIAYEVGRDVLCYGIADGADGVQSIFEPLQF